MALDTVARMSEQTSASGPSSFDDQTPAVPIAPTAQHVPTELSEAAESAAGSPAEYSPDAAPQVIENIGRGALLALLALPVGILAWVLLWQAGFIASIVGFGVAVAATFLYRMGSGGVISRVGAVIVIGVTALTLVLAFVAGLVSDVLPIYTDITGAGAVESLLQPAFWSGFSDIVSDPEIAGEIAKDAAIAFGLGALGCFSVLRGAFRPS